MKFINLLSALLFLICFSPSASAQHQLAQGEHFADINGVKIQYFVKGKGPVCVVPSPGWGPSVDYLKNSLQPFENYFTMVYYNTRLSGKSTGPDDPTKYTSLDLMHDMDNLRMHLEKPKVWLMGHSAGAIQSLYYGIHHSDNLNGIIAITPGAGRDSLDNVQYVKTIMKRKEWPNYEKISNVLLGEDTTRYTRSEWLDLTLPFFFHDTSYLEPLLQTIDTPFSDRAAEYTTASAFATEYLFPELNSIDVPTLCITGDDDFLSNKISQSDRIAKEIDNSQVIVIKNSGHFPWIEQPEQFYRKTTDWLQSQGLRIQN